MVKTNKKQQALMLAQKISNDIQQGECLHNEKKLDELQYNIQELQQVTLGIYIHQRSDFHETIMGPPMGTFDSFTPVLERRNAR